MTFFPEPLKPSEGRKEDEIIVNPIEADKKGKESGQGEVPDKKEGFYGSILVLLKKLTSLLTNQKAFTFSKDALTEDIEHLARLFNDLGMLDQSQNSQFCMELSTLWHRLLKHLHHIKKTKTITSIDVAKVKVVLSDMDHFPPNAERRLGYYLAEFAGREWLPVPFQEMLRLLHQDFKQKKERSILARWLELLKESLES